MWVTDQLPDVHKSNCKAANKGITEPDESYCIPYKFKMARLSDKAHQPENKHYENHITVAELRYQKHFDNNSKNIEGMKSFPVS